MRNANQAFRKDIEGTQQRLDLLNKTKVSLQVDTKIARDNINEASKELKKAKEGTEEFQKALERLEEAYSDHNRFADNLKLVSDEAKQAEKDIKSLGDTGSKLENKAGGDMLSRLAGAGAVSFVGGMLTDAANIYAGSALGREGSNIVSNALSSASMGAAIGTAIAPGIGTAIGAALGGLAGVAQGEMQNFQLQDDAFKEYYQSLYNTVTDAQAATLQSGIGIASRREQNQISFSTLLGGDDEATQFLSDVVDFAAVTPFDYDTLTDISKTLLAYGYQQEEILPLLEKIGDAGATLGMSPADMNAIAVSLGRMEISGKATIRYLQPLLDRGIPVWSYLAEASGKTTEEVMEMVSQGLIPGEEAAKAIADYMGAAGEGGMARQAETYSGLLSTLEDAQAEMDNAMGEGFVQERSQGVREQIEHLEGDAGESMKEAYFLIGQWQASLENLQDELLRDARSAVMTGILPESFAGTESEERIKALAAEYAELSQSEIEGGGAKMGALLAEAEALAINEYNASEGAQLQLNTQLDLAERIKNDTALNETYYDAGYRMGEQFSLGLASATEGIEAILTPGGITLGSGDGGVDSYVSGLQGNANAALGDRRGHAYGLDYVPYNNYPALLHEGERVLTASEARSQNSTPQVMVSGNNFTIREEADITKVATELARQLKQAYALAQ